MVEQTLDEEDDVALPARRANRPVTIAYRLEFILARILFMFFKLIGIDASSAIAGGFTRIVGPMLKPLTNRADENLRHAFPEWDAAHRKRVIAGVWENLGRTTAEFAHLDKFHPFEEGGRVEVIGANKVAALVESKTPAIFVSGHLANWEILPIAVHQAGIETALVYRAANNPLVDEMIIKARARVASQHLVPKGKRGGRAVIDAIKSGKSLAMLVDQKLNDGISVPFMGRDAMTAPAAARMSLKFGAPIIYSGVERLRGAHFRITVDDPIAFTPSGDTTQDVRDLTILINERLERDVRQRPEQWLWLHRRWPSAGKPSNKPNRA